MKIILSRKGFDNTSGGFPSPIFPNGRIISLPIPQSNESNRMDQLVIDNINMGSLVNCLSKGRVIHNVPIHLDPDLYHPSKPRLKGWRPMFGQSSSSLSHLRNQGVTLGDIFLFFGLFQDIIQINGEYRYSKSRPKHIIWGWLQIDYIIDENYQFDVPRWAIDHPHLEPYIIDNEKIELVPNNAIFVAKDKLNLCSVETNIDGGGVFKYQNQKLELSAEGMSTSIWKLPKWFYPKDRKSLSYHKDIKKWELCDNYTLLHTVGRGQEFVLDCSEYPEANKWLNELFLNI